MRPTDSEFWSLPTAAPAVVVVVGSPPSGDPYRSVIERFPLGMESARTWGHRPRGRGRCSLRIGRGSTRGPVKPG
ncbi:hypothetical protein GCM10027440_28670 [Nocardiopsis coralliicola]